VGRETLRFAQGDTRGGQFMHREAPERVNQELIKFLSA
jgi:hypothetical protein